MIVSLSCVHDSIEVCGDTSGIGIVEVTGYRRATRGRDNGLHCFTLHQPQHIVTMGREPHDHGATDDFCFSHKYSQVVFSHSEITEGHRT